ncbi:hypothetical protein JST97_29475 [bacterium]|nr:hypothetical protein [bacterium]
MAIKSCDFQADLLDWLHTRQRQAALARLFPELCSAELAAVSLGMYRRKLRAQYYRHYQLAYGLGAQKSDVRWLTTPELDECIRHRQPVLFAGWHYGPSYLLLEALIGWGHPTLALLGEGTRPGNFANLEIAYLDSAEPVSRHSLLLYKAYQALASGKVVLVMADAAWGKPDSVEYLGGQLPINPALKLLLKRTQAGLFPLIALEQPLGNPQIQLGPKLSQVSDLGNWISEMTRRYPEDLPEVRLWSRLDRAAMPPE